MFEITRTIYSDSERSEKFLVTECFLTCSWRFPRFNRYRTIRIEIGKIYWDLETCRKSWKNTKPTRWCVHHTDLTSVVVVVVQQNNVFRSYYSEIREELLDFLCLSGFFSHTFKNLKKNIDP